MASAAPGSVAFPRCRLVKGGKAFCPHRPRATAPHGIACASSQRVRDFIASECPVAGFDGKFRERPREAGLEAAVICFDAASMMVPGCQALLRVTTAQLEQVVLDKGQVLLCVMEQQGADGAGARVPLQPPKGGSYSSLAQAYGMQRLPEGQGGYIRVVARQRSLVQAVQGQTQSSMRAQAAVLHDRWAYYVRAQVVEEVLEAAMAGAGGPNHCSLETLNLNGQPADVRSAIASMQDVAQQLQAELFEQREMLLGVQKRQEAGGSTVGGGDSAVQVEEVLDEVTRILEFVQGPTGKCDVYTFGALERLSFAMFAFEQMAGYTGLSLVELQKQRSKAMELTDVGMRLEKALDLASALTARLSARVALT